MFTFRIVFNLRCRYSPAWTDDALDEIAKHSPLVEMGAGRGQWQRALTRERGADVLAFDNCSALPGVRSLVHSHLFFRSFVRWGGASYTRSTRELERRTVSNS